MFHWLLTLFVCRRSYCWRFCMFVQGQHIDIVNFVIWHYFQFDLSLTFDPLCVGRTKTSPWTLLHLRPRLTQWPLYFHLTHFVIWPFFNLWPFNSRSERSPWTLMHVCPTPTNWPFYICHFTHLLIWPFLTFDPLSVGRTKRSPWTLLHLRPRLTHWPFYFCHLTYFVIWPFLTFDS